MRGGDALLLSAALLAVALAFAVGDAEPTRSKQELHCEMVQIWNETDGEYGWPDYNNTAHNCEAKDLLKSE